MATAQSADNNAASEQHGPEFAIQRIYMKDSSFETPKAPEIFREQWEPQVNIDLQTSSKKIEDKIYEVVLGVTVTVKIKEMVAFLVEVKQAGIFSIGEFPEEQLGQLLGSFCPNILFPYARESITSMVTRGGFPQLYLAPINFDAVYQQQVKQREEAESAN
ncbi:MAG: protein-export chaperone SecB [Pseudomonadota bacterium]|nr:protein-export chaperone SecB [Pseudomonadota bacterium]